MFKRIASLVLASTLVCGLGGTSTFGSITVIPGYRLETGNEATFSASSKEREPARSLKDEIAKLVADARAGAGLSIESSQTIPRHGNRFSTRAKIAIAAGVGVAVLLAVMYYHFRRHLFD